MNNNNVTCISIFKNRKGSTTIIFAMSFIIIAAMSALVVDIGIYTVEKQHFQTAIDAATIAAASDLPDNSKAIATAQHYMVINGFKANDISVNFSHSNRKIILTGTKKVNFTFAKLIGLDSTYLNRKATAELGIVGTAFDYALFSGSRDSQLTLNGSSDYVYGDVHSNYTIVVNGSKITISGQCDAVSSITVNGNKVNIGESTENIEYIEMPDFSEIIKNQASATGTYYIGSQTFNNRNIYIGSSIYVDGDVTIDGSYFIGKGSILATGNITINGSNLNANIGDAVCLYSKAGNITFNGSNSNLDGILYAPNGSITMNGSNQSINGRVIGNSLNFNGSDLNIVASTNDITALPKSYIKLVE
jgi:Flp pilus assembly protein TadG